MATLIKLEPSKSYISESNARRAVESVPVIANNKSLRYFVMVYNGSTEKHVGRFFPVFVGQNCIDEGVHFYFNVIG